MTFNFSDGLICRPLPNFVVILSTFSNNNYVAIRPAIIVLSVMNFDRNKTFSEPKNDHAFRTQMRVKTKAS
jgi:hypothetical protein